ncbi:MAG: DUF2207 domain-containing protein, partial [Lachnospiraceae bacterium]|nr:DUF2207 domain-containing protein [Lachnospiraceae bacterium]
MRKHRQYFCRIVVCLILVLSIVPIMTVCANADSNTDIDMNIGDSYVYDGDYMVWKQDGGYYSYNVSTAELNYIGDTYYPRQISGEYDEDGNKVFNATDGDLIIWREADGFYFFDTVTQNMGYYGVSYSGYTDTSSDIGTGLSQMDQYSGYDYVIDSYEVQINVNEDNTFEIEEYITVYFNEPRHGIYRDIPLTNNIHRADGTKSKNRVNLSDVRVSEESDASIESGNYRIKIGSADTTVTGTKEYGIEYTYDIGVDPLKNADEFYFNIIGDNWTSPIGGVTFTINMPKEFDAGKLGFSAGAAGTVGTDEVEYKVSGNTITGSYK